MSDLWNRDACSAHIQAKPYCHCSSCVLQIFYRGKLAIQRLTDVIELATLRLTAEECKFIDGLPATEQVTPCSLLYRHRKVMLLEF